jgi:hypothetical protein
VAAAAAYAECTSTPSTSTTNTLTRCSIPAPAASRVREVGHHLPGLRGHVCAADELAVLIDGVLAADVHRRGARRDDSDVAEGRTREESFGTQQLDLGHVQEATRRPRRRSVLGRRDRAPTDGGGGKRNPVLLSRPLEPSDRRGIPRLTARSPAYQPDPGVRLEMPSRVLGSRGSAFHANGEPGLVEVWWCTRTGVASKRPIGTRPGDGQKGGQHVCAGDPGPCVRRRAGARAA